MQKITSTIALKDAIFKIEIKQAEQEAAVKERFNRAIASLNPLNSFKSMAKDFVSSPNLTTNLVDSAIGLTMGIISKKAIVGKSKNPLVNILGTLLEIGITRVVSKNPEGIKSIARQLYKRFSGKEQSNDTKTP